MFEGFETTKHLHDYVSGNEVFLSKTNYPINQRIPLHSHDFYELYVVTQGSLIHDYNGRQIALEKGAMQLIHPLDIHRYEGHGNQSNTLVNIAFSGQVHDELCQFLSITKELGGLVQLKPYQVDLLNHRLTLVDHKALTLKQLLIGLYLDYYCQPLTHRQVADNDTVPYWLKKAMNLMLLPENLHLGLNRFVELSGKSKEHLARTVKRLFGITAGRWVSDHRLEYAKILIHESEATILELAFEVGFNSESYFYRQYKAYFGITPSEERQG